MIGRLVATAIMLALAAAGCWGNALGAGHPVNPFGLLCLFLAIITWFKWGTIRDGFYAARGESELPIMRLAATIIGGMGSMRRGPPLRRSSSSNP